MWGSAVEVEGCGGSVCLVDFLQCLQGLGSRLELFFSKEDDHGGGADHLRGRWPPHNELFFCIETCFCTMLAVAMYFYFPSVPSSRHFVGNGVRTTRGILSETVFCYRIESPLG